MYVTLIPAFGRDYKYGKDALADYNAGKDFILCTYDRPSVAINKSQCDEENFLVTIRFAKNRKTVNAY